MVYLPALSPAKSLFMPLSIFYLGSVKMRKHKEITKDMMPTLVTYVS